VYIGTLIRTGTNFKKKHFVASPSRISKPVACKPKGKGFCVSVRDKLERAGYMPGIDTAFQNPSAGLVRQRAEVMV
jgi:hypothetical protein